MSAVTWPLRRCRRPAALPSPRGRGAFPRCWHGPLCLHFRGRHRPEAVTPAATPPGRLIAVPPLRTLGLPSVRSPLPRRRPPFLRPRPASRRFWAARLRCRHPWSSPLLRHGAAVSASAARAGRRVRRPSNDPPGADASRGAAAQTRRPPSVRAATFPLPTAPPPAPRSDRDGGTRGILSTGRGTGRTVGSPPGRIVAGVFKKGCRDFGYY